MTSILICLKIFFRSADQGGFLIDLLIHFQCHAVIQYTVHVYALLYHRHSLWVQLAKQVVLTLTGNPSNSLFFTRNASWVLMKCDRKEVVMVSFKCCCFSDMFLISFQCHFCGAKESKASHSVSLCHLSACMSISLSRFAFVGTMHIWGEYPVLPFGVFIYLLFLKSDTHTCLIVTHIVSFTCTVSHVRLLYINTLVYNELHVRRSSIIM